MKIAHIDLGEKPLMLAPMEDVTDRAFRKMCKNFGADMLYTEFVSADALIRNVKKTCNKATIDPQERPIAIQIYGRDAETMAQAAVVVEQMKPDIIDLNFGCPMKKVAGKGAGAGLLQDPPKLIEITKQVVQAVKTPVTVKTRLGWDANSIIITDLAEALQDCGIAALTVHARTRSQLYTGQADWSYIARLKDNQRIKIPIIGNGDLQTPAQCLEAFNRYGADGVMIGRATFGRPWIFAEVKHFLTHGQTAPTLPFAQGIEILKELTTQCIAASDERGGILHVRRHLAATPLLKGIPNFRTQRIEMLRATTKETLFEMLDGFVQQYGAAYDAGEYA